MEDEQRYHCKHCTTRFNTNWERIEHESWHETNRPIDYKALEAMQNDMQKAFYIDVLKYEEALQKIADLIDSEADDPLDEAIDIALRALGRKT